MKLYIRSQDKEVLTIADSVYYDNFHEDKIYAQIGRENFTLGQYKTKERCLEIINEIQEILTHNGVMLFKNVDVSEIPREAFEPFKALTYLPNGDIKSEVTIHNAEVVVYEMPKE